MERGFSNALKGVISDKCCIFCKFISFYCFFFYYFYFCSIMYVDIFIAYILISCVYEFFALNNVIFFI